MRGHGTYSGSDTSHSGTSMYVLAEVTSNLTSIDTHNIATDVFLHVDSPPLLAGAACVSGSHPASTTKAPSLQLFGAIFSYIS